MKPINQTPFRSPFTTALAISAMLMGGQSASAQTLGGASNSAIVASTGVTAAGPAGTVVNGDVSSSPTASISGFPPAEVLAPFRVHDTNDAYAVAATAAVNALYVELGAGACTTNPGPQMASATFTPGIHCFAAAADLAALSTVRLNGSGTYIFRVGTALTANVGSSVILEGGANACNVFWRMGTESATLNGLNFPGNVVAHTSVTLGTGMNLTGRALTRTGAVTMAGTNRVGGCSTPPPPPVCPAITLSPTTLPNGTVAVAYNQTITATGGTGPYVFSLFSGALPGGLTLTAGGVIAGTPLTAGSFTFTVRGTDANGCFGNPTYTIVITAAPTPPPVCPTITLAPTALPNGTVAIAYSQTLSASGGTAPYSFGITTGSAPTGLTLTPAGVLAGTPTIAGTSNFTVRATDANGCFAERPYTLVVAAAPVPPPVCPAITVSPATLPNGTVAVAYSQAISATGGTAPYAFGVTSGSLPAGLSLTAAGVLQGTPTIAASSLFTVRATDANGCFAERAYTVVIAAAPAPPPVCPTITVLPATLPAGAILVPYSQTITASGGTAPYSFGLTAGALPAGLVMSATGTIAGTPTVAGTATFTVRATDASGCFREIPYSIEIPPAPPVPTLPEWSMLFLILLLAIAGFLGLRGQKPHATT